MTRVEYCRKDIVEKKYLGTDYNYCIWLYNIGLKTNQIRTQNIRTI